MRERRCGQLVDGVALNAGKPGTFWLGRMVVAASFG